MDQKRPKLTVFFKNFHNRTLVLLEVANFSKILLVNLGFGRSLAKSCLNLTFQQKQGFTAVLYMNFLPKSWNFPNFILCLLENQRFLAKSLENFA
jgi:hypothetical protein